MFVRYTDAFGLRQPTPLCFWLVLTYLADRSIYRIWSIREVDSEVTLKLAKKVLLLEWLPNPFEKLEKGVKERSDLQVAFAATEGFTFRPRGGEMIGEGFLSDRRQYRLRFENSGRDVMENVRLRLQLLYPIEHWELGSAERVHGFRFLPVGVVTLLGDGETKVLRRPLTRVYEFEAGEIPPKGHLELLLLLNSWRDPRGKTVPPEEAVRYFVHDVGPTVTYIDGSYQLRSGEEEVKKSFYAPFELLDDKTVVFGLPGPPPAKLIQEISFE